MRKNLTSEQVRDINNRIGRGESKAALVKEFGISWVTLDQYTKPGSAEVMFFSSQGERVRTRLELPWRPSVGETLGDPDSDRKLVVDSVQLRDLMVPTPCCPPDQEPRIAKIDETKWFVRARLLE